MIIARLGFKGSAWQTMEFDLFVISCWHIWKARNKEVFSDLVIRVVLVMNQILSLLEIVTKTCNNNKGSSSGNHLNLESTNSTFHGSSFGNPGKAGFGSLIQDNHGHWIMWNFIQHKCKTSSYIPWHWCGLARRISPSNL